MPNILRNKYIIAIGTICFIIITVVSACIFSNRDNFIFQLENQSNRKKKLSELLSKNNITKDIPNIKKYISIGDVEYFEAVDIYKRIIFTFFLTYPIPELGTRSYSFTFDEDKNCLLWSKDNVVCINGGLLDLTGDNYLDKIVDFTEETKTSNIIKFINRFQVFTFIENNPKKLLDVIYNLNSSPGDENYLLLEIEYKSRGMSAEILLVSPFGNQNPIRFSWSQKNAIYNIKGDKSRNWQLIFPNEGESVGKPGNPGRL